MGFLDNKTDQNYYAASQNFRWNTGDDRDFTITTIDPLPTAIGDFWVYKNGALVSSSNYTYNGTSKVLSINASYSLSNNDLFTVQLKTKVYGDYRYTKLSDLVNNFMFSYVGDGKIWDSDKVDRFIGYNLEEVNMVNRKEYYFKNIGHTEQIYRLY